MLLLMHLPHFIATLMLMFQLFVLIDFDVPASCCYDVVMFQAS
jgi:hypothetical protein